MKKSLTENEFNAVTKHLNMGKRAREIAYGVMVKNKPQKLYSEKYSITSGAVSQTVSKVWRAYDAFLKRNASGERQCSDYEHKIPDGYKKVEAVLPEDLAKVVKTWNDKTLKEIKSKS